MDKPEWMPVMPCPACEAHNKCLMMRTECPALMGFFMAEEYQKKLLEYLKKSSKGFTKIYHWWNFEEMLRQLEKE
jgi:hypothetical protein